MQDEIDQQMQPMQLPEWKAALETMRQEGVAFGKQYTVEFFEEAMRVKRTDFRFGIHISHIRRELEKDGFYLNGRGGRGKLWNILPPVENTEMVLQYGRMAARALSRGVILGTNTSTESMSVEERQRHEAVLERMATKAALLSRSREFSGLLKDK